MALTQPQLALAWKDFADDTYGPSATTSCKFTKADLLAAATAVDGWIEANQASFNSSLPVPFRTTASPAEKTALFSFVAFRRLRG